MGRTVRNGRLAVHGVPAGSVIALLEASIDAPIEGAGPADSEGRLAKGFRGILVCDAETDSDLEQTGLSEIAAGTGAFAGIWAKALPVARRAKRKTLPRGPCLVVNGSLHPASLGQVGRPENLDADAEVLAGDIDRAGFAILTSAPEPRRNASVVAASLAAKAAAVLCRVCVGTLVIFGGATTIAVLRELNVNEVEPVSEFLAGIPVSRFAYGTRNIGLVTKAGGFGGPDTLTRILEKLR
jgi:uncharacterized protein YgbK (DUF1537 family)